jgi:hypothetical protein
MSPLMWKCFFEESVRRTHIPARALICVWVFLLITACTGPGIEKPNLVKERNVQVDNIPDPEVTVRGKDDPPVVTLQLGSALKPVRLRPSEEIPAHIKIGSTNLNNVPVTVAMQAVLADTDITLLWDKAELQERTVTLLNLKGSLPVVVNRICRAAKLLCAYRNGALELTDVDTFVVEMPAAPGAMSSTGSSATTETISETIKELIDGQVKVDTTGGNLIYTTDADGFERVQSYLEQLRNGRPLIVLQLYIWQVTLDDNQQMGVNWSQFEVPEIGGKNQTAFLNSISAFRSVAATSGVSLGAVLSGAVDANMVARFLSTQGRVQNISSPQLTFVSGTSAKFENGGVQRFVSQVGTLVSGTISGNNPIVPGVGNNTVSTEDLKLGLSVTATGNYESGVVMASLEIKTSDLVRVNEISANGTTLQLPQTNDRTVSTVLRVRPGDNLVLAGLQTSTDTRARDGLPVGGTGNSLPMFSSNVVSNSETVILVKPSVVFFSDREASSPRLAEIVPKTQEPESPAAIIQAAAPIMPAPAPPPPAVAPPTATPLPTPLPRTMPMSQATGAPMQIATPTAPAPSSPAMASPITASSPPMAEPLAVPVRRSPLQDEFADAVRRFQDNRTGVPENIKPRNSEVQTP